MRIDPDIVIKLKLLDEPGEYDKAVYGAFNEHIRSLREIGIHDEPVIRNWGASYWSEKLTDLLKSWWSGLPSQSGHTMDKSLFEIEWVLVYTKLVRTRWNAWNKNVDMEQLKLHIGALIKAGIKVGGGEQGVRIIFKTPEEFNAWADNPSPVFERRTPHPPFSPYPREE